MVGDKEDAKTVFRRQKYKLFGENAGAKLCHWTRESIMGKGVCYKQQFYGIPSHRCLQLSPCVFSCTQNCLFCWRVGDFVPAISKEDEPRLIVEEALRAQKEMVSGYLGIPEASREKWKQANEPTQAAISLSGEPTLYSRLPELIEEFRKRGMTTFVVSNGSQPDMIERINPSQLYISLIAGGEESFKRLGAPFLPDAWERLGKSLEAMAGKKGRTVNRLTLVKGYNLEDDFAPLIEKARPWFIEAKSYMHVGYSIKRLEKANQLSFDEVKKFAQELAEKTGYLYLDENKISKVVLLARSEREARERFLKCP